MAEEYRLETLLQLRKRRVETARKDLQTKQESLEEQRRRLELMIAEEWTLSSRSEVQGRAQYINHCKKVIQDLEQALEQIQHELDEEQEELWILQMHKEKWTADQE